MISWEDIRMSYSVEWWSDPAEFLTDAYDFLEENALLTNVVGTAATLAESAGSTDSLYGLVRDSYGHGVSVALWDSGRPVFVSHPRAAPASAIGASLAERGLELLGVSGAPTAVKAFASALGKGDCLARCSRRLGLFDAPRHVSPVGGVAGKPRPAVVDDIDDLQVWVDRLALETTSKPFSVQRNVEKMYSNMSVWTLNGRPVAMAKVSPSVHGVRRISSVYSPTKYSGRRYELALVVHLVSDIQEQGDNACLFLDATRSVWVRTFKGVGFKEMLISETWVLAGNSIDSTSAGEVTARGVELPGD